MLRCFACLVVRWSVRRHSGWWMLGQFLREGSTPLSLRPLNAVAKAILPYYYHHNWKSYVPTSTSVEYIFHLALWRKRIASFFDQAMIPQT
jgi:hypothetical protein